MVPVNFLAYSFLNDPLPVWDHWVWLLIPLTVLVSVIYKSIKCAHMREVPLQSAVISFWILAGMSLSAVLLAGLVNLLQ